MQLRPTSPCDLPALIPMIIALSSHHGDDSAPDREGLAELLWGARSLGTAWWFSKGSDVAGYAITAEFGRFHLGTRGLELIHLYILPEHRGGAGRDAMRLIEEQAVRLGMDRVILTAGTAQIEAFYEGLGYCKLPVSNRFRRLLI